MAELNKVMLIGRLTKDPEMRYTPSGTAITDFRLAANHSYRTRDNEKREEVCFIDINVIGRGAEVAKEYLAKGREVFIEGRLQLNTWDGPDGQKRSKYRVVADRFQFLGPGRVLPYRVIPTGFGINTLFYAVLLWLPICGPFALRRFIRRKRGRCPACAYPMGGSAVCTECGRALPGRAEAAT